MRKACLIVFLVIFGIAGWTVLKPTSEDAADPQKTKPCGAIECSVNELCCFTGCPPQDTCLPRSVGKCPPPLPCPQPGKASAAPGDCGR